MRSIMTPHDDPPIYQLPEELLLHVASYLPDAAAPTTLMDLSLTSRRFRSVAQDALYTTVKLSMSCGSHPKVSSLLQLLRTLLDRADLATKIRTLRVGTIRKNVAKLCEQQDFDLASLRMRSLAKLEQMGNSASHPWHRTIRNSIESGFAGLLLALLPNLTHLEVWVKDHPRGPPSGECISGLFGGMFAPAGIIHGWSTLRHLTTSDTHLLKSGIHYENLKSLDLKTISIGTILRLNGRGCLQGAENLDDLALSVSIQFADRPLVEKAEIQLSDLFEALDCSRLRSLKMQLINDSYHLTDDRDTQLDASYLIDQLDSMRDSLERLAITHEITDDDSDLEWLLGLLTNQKRSFKHFTNLKHLTIPQLFFFNEETDRWLEHCCQPRDLPPKLETLEILYPQSDIEDWVQVERFQPPGYQDDPALGFQAKLPSALWKITLTCRDEVGSSASSFTKDVEPIWVVLSFDLLIETYVFCQTQGNWYNLKDLRYEQLDMNEEETDSDMSAMLLAHSGPQVESTDSELETTDSGDYDEESDEESDE
ncbi:hypothetical protein J4E89_009419 [Alternaria sp. Ai002NY15]|nr:hypothetical protein J4E89_009419 [Alternaria sp. Ai002NY15]